MSAESHYAAGSQLLGDVNDAADSPSAQRVLTQAAIAHALLGLLEIEIGKTPPVRDPNWAYNECCGKCPGGTCHVDQITGA